MTISKALMVGLIMALLSMSGYILWDMTTKSDRDETIYDLGSVMTELCYFVADHKIRTGEISSRDEYVPGCLQDAREKILGKEGQPDDDRRRGDKKNRAGYPD